MGWTWNQTQSRPKICRPYVVCTSCGAWQYTSKAKKKVWCKCGEPFHIPDAGDKSTQASQVSEKGAPQQDQDMKSILTAILGVLSDAQKQELGPAAQSAAAFVTEKKPAPAVAAVAALQRVRQHEKKVTELGIHVQELETQLQAAKDDRAKVTMELQEARQQFEAVSQQATAQWGTATAAEDAMEEDQEAKPKEAPAAEQPKASVPELPPGLRAAVSGLQGEDAEQAQAFVQQLEAATKAGKAPPPKRPPPKRQGAAGGLVISQSDDIFSLSDSSESDLVNFDPSVASVSAMGDAGKELMEGGLWVKTIGGVPIEPKVDSTCNGRVIDFYVVFEKLGAAPWPWDELQVLALQKFPKAPEVLHPVAPEHVDETLTHRLQRLIEATVVNLNWDSNLADDQQWALWHSLKERSSEPFPLHDLLEQQVQFYETRALKQAQDGFADWLETSIKRGGGAAHAFTREMEVEVNPEEADNLVLEEEALDPAIFHRINLLEMWFELVESQPRLRNGIELAWPKVVTKLQRPRRWNNVVSHLSAVDGVDIKSSWWQIERMYRDGQKNLAKALKAVGACSAWSPRRRFEAGLADDSVCPLCGYHHCDDYHKFWGCPLLFQADHPLIPATEDLVDTAQGDDQPACLWLRGLIPAARTGQVQFLKVKSHAADPEVRARFPAWALYVNEQADEFAGQAAASAAVPQDLVDRVLALDTLAEQVRGRLAAVQMMWWTHYPVEEAPAETKRAQRKERSDNAFQHLLEVTAHWPQVRGDQVSCSRCGRQTHRRCCARWLRPAAGAKEPTRAALPAAGAAAPRAGRRPGGLAGNLLRRAMRDAEKSVVDTTGEEEKPAAPRPSEDALEWQPSDRPGPAERLRRPPAKLLPRKSVSPASPARSRSVPARASKQKLMTPPQPPRRWGSPDRSSGSSDSAPDEVAPAPHRTAVHEQVTPVRRAHTAVAAVAAAAASVSRGLAAPPPPRAAGPRLSRGRSRSPGAVWAISPDSPDEPRAEVSGSISRWHFQVAVDLVVVCVRPGQMPSTARNLAALRSAPGAAGGGSGCFSRPAVGSTEHLDSSEVRVLREGEIVESVGPPFTLPNGVVRLEIAHPSSAAYPNPIGWVTQDSGPAGAGRCLEPGPQPVQATMRAGRPPHGGGWRPRPAFRPPRPRGATFTNITWRPSM
ncbi:unnamed protein product [Prorocentrum cordatum]|uniref:Uncharacterized protein n=1 Tax=Prorocentrum cordatum TaxID=2364126 RepID=A0ABN9VA34_9DINO|nr:unnamed protein product [Polarella glacialis]